MWEDVEGQESFPVSAGFELTTLGLLVQEHNYSATTHTQFAEYCSSALSSDLHACDYVQYHVTLTVILARTLRVGHVSHTIKSHTTTHTRRVMATWRTRTEPNRAN